MGLDTIYLSANDGDAYCDVWTGSESDGDYLYDWGTDSNITKMAILFGDSLLFWKIL